MSKTCMLPWLHFFVDPSGKVNPCCIYDKPFTDLKNKNSINDIVNSTEFKELRLKMLNGEEDAGCMKCYNEERLGMFSDRLRYNDAWKHHSNLIEQTNPDGSIDNFKMKYLDIRWDNICNLRCRTCSPELSSRIAPDYIKLNWLEKPIKVANTDMLYSFIVEQINDIEEFYFVGGEPLLMEKHYKILNELIVRQKFDARLTYSTNLTVLSFRDKSILDYWSQLTNVLVMVSVDAMGERAKVLRCGTNWDELLSNITTVKNTAPHVQIKIASVFSLYNALHLPDLQQFLLEQNIVTADQLEINVAYGDTFCPKNIIPSGKVLVQEKANKFIEWTKANGYYNQNIQDQWDRCLTYMNSEQINNVEKIANFNNDLDHIRNESLFAAFPEISQLIKI